MRRAVPALLLAACAAAAAVPAPAAAAADARPRIVNGQPAAAQAWPAQALITGTQGILASGCGGTLVSARWVLTAAHCVNGAIGGAPLAPSAFSIRLGSSRRDEGGKVHGVDRVVRHEAPGDNDVALLHLTEASEQEPMALVGQDEASLWAAGTPATIVGWGLTRSGGSGSPDLLQAQVPIVGDQPCTDAWGSTFKPASQVCAGGTGTDVCSGDSGGPLLVPRAGGHVLVGVASYGSADGCGTDRPSVFARVGGPALGAWVRDRVPTLTVRAAGARTAAVKAGVPVALSTEATGPDPAAPVTWDLDDDGAFDDATGPAVTAVFAAGARTVRAVRTLPDGDRAPSSARVDVAAVPAGTPFTDPAGGGTVITTAVGSPATTYDLRRARRLGLRVPVSCAAACSGRASLTVGAADARRLGLRGTRRIATGTVDRADAGISAVRLRFRKGLPRAARLRARLDVRLDAAGQTARLRRTLTGRG